MVLLLVSILIGIFIGIYLLFKRDADKKETKINWFYVIFSYIPFGLFFGFLLIVLLHGRTGF